MTRGYHTRMFGLGLGLALCLATTAHAEPTPPDRFLSWEHSGVGIAGFWIYYAPESESPPVFSNARRVQVANAATRTLALVDVTPAAQAGQGPLLFKITAYDSGGRESAYTDANRPGWFGLPAASQFGVSQEPPAP